LPKSRKVYEKNPETEMHVWIADTFITEGLVHKSTVWRTGLEPAFVAVPGDWVPPIPGGMTGVVYNDYTE